MRKSFWDDVTSWPSLSDAAAMLRLHKATISRHAQRGRVASRAVGLGRGKRVIPPAEVLRLGRLYQRVSMDDLERHLATFVALRTNGSAKLIEQEMAEAMVTADTPGEPGESPDFGRAVSGIPWWMVEFDRLMESPSTVPDTSTFAVSSAESVGTYTGTYRDADDVTLEDLTGLAPAIFR